MSDLISRSNLLKELEYYISHTPEDSIAHYAYIRCKDLADRMPTIEAVPVVHGEWIDNTGCLDSVRKYKCSNCGKKPITNMHYVTILSDFCPNCGADMRKGGAE